MGWETYEGLFSARARLVSAVHPDPWIYKMLADRKPYLSAPAPPPTAAACASACPSPAWAAPNPSFPSSLHQNFSPPPAPPSSPPPNCHQPRLPFQPNRSQSPLAPLCTPWGSHPRLAGCARARRGWLCSGGPEEGRQEEHGGPCAVRPVVPLQNRRAAAAPMRTTRLPRRRSEQAAAATPTRTAQLPRRRSEQAAAASPTRLPLDPQLRHQPRRWPHPNFLTDQDAATTTSRWRKVPPHPDLIPWSAHLAGSARDPPRQINSSSPCAGAARSLRVRPESHVTAAPLALELQAQPHCSLQPQI